MNKLFLVLLIICVLLQVSYAAENQAVAVLLDISRSVAPQDFDAAKKTITRLTEEYRDPDVLLLYVFGSELKKIDAAQVDAVEATESYTTLFDAAYDAAQDLSSVPASRKAILIFSDGNDTRSVTILEDIVSYAREQGIVIYGIGIGPVKRGDFGRMTKLTSGNLFELRQDDLVHEIQSAVASQKTMPKVEPAQVETAKTEPVVTEKPAAPTAAPPASQPAAVSVVSNKALFFGVILGVGLLCAIAFFLIRRRQEVRVCPTCGKQLDSTQMVCPDCASDAEVPVVEEEEEEDIAQTMKRKVPEEWLKKSELTQEVMTRTTMLTDSPILLVKKGKNLGQSYPMSRETPVSIGRSRVNEIRLDDLSVSGQHCRIIPEKGNHVLLDLESSNGTYVNNEKVTSVVLKQGDIVRVGETFFVYMVEQTHSN